jgi:primosomal protein N' (replication factor Y)
VTALRAVRIITEVAAVDRPFDYALTEATGHCGVGDRVRIDFNHRSVRGWVVGEVEPDRELKPLTKWLGYGPPPSLLELLTWASERWCSPLSRFLISSSPKRLITQLPDAPRAAALNDSVSKSVLCLESGVIQTAPTTDPLPLILGAYESTREREGSLLVLVPTEAWASRLRGRLEQRGCAVASHETEWDRMRAGWPVVVGSRGAALAPVPKVAGAVIIDADDESYRSESAPTWDALSMLRERCRRDDAPLWATSMIPSPVLVNDEDCEKVGDVAQGWPRIQVVDRRNNDPRDGVLSRSALDVAHRALRGDEPVAVVVVLQRLGTGRLFACRSCGELARCAQCGQGEEEVGTQLACRDRHELRANFCRSCGATNLKRVRVGVTTLARDVAAQLSQAVSEVTSASDAAVTLHRVVVGTEAVWQRVRRCGVVIFVDFDQYLLAPRESSRRSAITAVGKAGRLVGSRRDARGEVVLQTRRGDDQVIRALEQGDFDAIVSGDIATAKLLALPPYGGVATISGEAAEEFVSLLGQSSVSVYQIPEGFVVRAGDVEALTLALRSVSRPGGKLRVAVQ